MWICAWFETRRVWGGRSERYLGDRTMVRVEFVLRNVRITVKKVITETRVGADMGSGVVTCLFLVILRHRRNDVPLVREGASLGRGSELAAGATVGGVEGAHNNQLGGGVEFRAKLSDFEGQV